MKRVSFLLMLILAVALVFALSSCGECEHVAGDPVKENCTEANCKNVEKYESVVYCTECGAEMSRTSVKGEGVGSHVAGEPVYENIDVVDCSKGGTADKVTYCTVARCGAEISREKDVPYTEAHEIVKNTSPVFNTSHTQASTLEYCKHCTYYKLTPTDVSGALALRAQAAKHSNMSGTCTYCNYVIGTYKIDSDSDSDAAEKDNLKYTLNDSGDGYILVGLKDAKGPVPQSITIGEYKGKPVVEIKENAFKGVSGIRFLVVGSQLQKIGANAFQGCKIEKVTTYDLESWCKIEFVGANANPLSAAKSFSISDNVVVNGVLSIPEGITEISAYSFAKANIKALYIPSSLVKIENNAFEGCDELINVHIASSSSSREFEESVFADCDNIRNVYADSIVDWLSNSFDDAKANPLYYTEAFKLGANKAVLGTSLAIPASITEIPEYAFANLNITTLDLNNVTTVGAGAFAGCTALETVKLGNSVQTLSDYAFSGCAAIKSVVLPDSVTSLGDGIFSGCTSLTEVSFGSGISSIGGAAFSGCTSLKSLALPENLTSLSAGIFQNCSALVSVTFGANLSKIEASAFENCVSITAFTFTALIDEIESNAFAGCTGLATLSLNYGLDKIGSGAFKNCGLLTEITVPDSVYYIGLGAFEGCNAVKKISLPFIGENKYDSSANTHFGYIFGAPERWLVDEQTKANIKLLAPDNRSYVPYTLESIAITSAPTIYKYAFSGCDSIVNLTLPSDLKTVESYAFEECTSLSKVYFTSLKDWCKIDFENYSANPLVNANGLYINNVLLTEVTIPEGISVILPYTFYGASEITKIVIPEGVTRIGNDAFSHCTALKVIELPASLTTVDARAFVSCDSIQAVKIVSLAVWCNVSFADMVANPLYYSDSLMVGDSVITELAIPDGVTAISDYAFAGCDFLESVAIAGTVAYVGNYAFYGCDNEKLTTVNLPASVIEIGESAFENCSSIESAILGSAVEIGKRAFADCTALKGIAVPNTVVVIRSEAFSGCSAMEIAALGNSVVTIETSAFFGCAALKEINIPLSVKTIAAHAFAGCDALTTVTFEIDETPGAVAKVWVVEINNVETIVSANLENLKKYSVNEWNA